MALAMTKLAETLPRSDRIATPEDCDALSGLIERAIDDLQKPYLNADQIATSHIFMGLDRQLVLDGTYFVVEQGGRIAGCGGWSRRATPYGADHTPDRDNRLLDPATEPARIRAMYTHPDFVRQGIGSHIIALCEAAARAEGFRRIQLTATMAGVPLYRFCGFEGGEEVEDRGVPMLLMEKSLS